MSQIDIVARLQLRADQFTSEQGKAFAEMKTRAASTAQEIRTGFGSAFAEVQKIASQALTMPRTTSGGLDLSSEIASLNASAAAAENRADAFREMQVAALAVAQAGHVEAEALRRDADAAMVAVHASEAAAAADRKRISALEALQAELNATASVTAIANRETEAHAIRQVRAAETSGAMRSAMQGLSYQAQDTFTQLSMNANVFSVLAVQGGQAAGAFAHVEGAAGAVGRFFLGPWGLAITAGLLVLGKLTEGMLDNEESAKAAQKASEDLARSVANIGDFFDTTTGKIKETNRALVQFAVLSRQRKNDELRGQMDANARAGNAAYGESRRDLEPVFAERGIGRNAPKTINFDVTDAIRGRQNIDAKLREIAASNSSNAAQAGKILEQRAAFAKSAQEIARNDKEIASLLSGSLDKSLIDAPASRGSGGRRTGGGTRRVREDDSAQRAQAEADRKAKAAQDALAASFDSLIARYDPATAAANRYRIELAEIAKLQSLPAGNPALLSPEAAERYARAAKEAMLRVTNPEVFAPTKGLEGFLEADKKRTDAAAQALRDQQEEAERQFRELSGTFEDLFTGGVESVWRTFKQRGIQALSDIAAEEAQKLLFGLGPGNKAQPGAANDNPVTELRGVKTSIDRLGVKLPKGISESMAKTVVQGAGLGAVGGSVFASITGGKQNTVSSAAGGVLGEYAGKAAGKALSGLLGSASSMLGPIGAIAGGVLGNLVGGLFQKTKQASSTITFGSGGLSAGAATGTGTAEKAAASASANSVVGSLNRIAEALGGDVTGAGSVSIGYRPGHKAGAYRVDTTGQGRLTGVLAFATEEEAIRAAIADALKDGVIGGISDASKRILAAGGDLEKAITKASLIEAVPKSLKAMLDPVGAAVDDLNRSFQKTVDALKEGGASADQMAQAQRLYELQLAQVKNSTESASASLKDFLDSMKLGSDSPLSLRDQEAAALTKLQPFLDQIAGGQAIDQAKYQAAAKTYLDVERQLYGSTQGFFDAFDKVQASTAKAISTIDNAVPVTPGVASPFAKETADSAAATAAGVKVGNEMTEDTNGLLAQIASLMAQVASNTGAGGSSPGFIGDGRSFVSAA